MFAGIVEETGRIKSILRSNDGIHLQVETQKTGRDLQIGNSLSVNGCCLTAVTISSSKSSKIVSFDLLKETWKKTNLQYVRENSLVNLERPLRADGRFEGHIVSGHVEGMAKVHRWESVKCDWCLEIIPPKTLLKYIVEKGSIAIDGISLTVAKIISNRLRIWIIPHTYKMTRFKQVSTGDDVNIETDIIGKYVERMMHKSTT